MISDVVLSKELPPYIKDSVEAYVGCIAGAVTKDEYLESVKAAGFQDVAIIDETRVPVEEWINDSSVKSITEKLHISVEEAKNALSAVASVKVKGCKAS